MVWITRHHGARGSLPPTLLLFGVVGVLACAPRLGAGIAPAVDTYAWDARPVPDRPQPDLSGRQRTGIASFYADRFAGRKMADGAIMDPHGSNAASRTLPLGTVARVTDLATHKSAVITIEDRGPYVQGRIVDLSPATARQIGITRKAGIAKVSVAPISVPLPDGRMLLARASPPH